MFNVCVLFSRDDCSSAAYNVVVTVASVGPYELRNVEPGAATCLHASTVGHGTLSPPVMNVRNPGPVTTWCVAMSCIHCRQKPLGRSRMVISCSLHNVNSSWFDKRFGAGCRTRAAPRTSAG